ncbi:hypothetical protein GCM10023142_36570 [Anaerocolumna aminovalerica]|jgi:Na+/proline symporter|uniref:Uncharacterized protein n=1 Tax=Anaerocolumna aminovalerica TaxID=1527 RepID=A0A1I5H6J3_9FIRM|nr:hypothetical protein [Anaerocolumna aminovalerica]MBU5332712.1 hypothetical protein [Anaerocolumna aminovalerica]MDU6265532.1 hypothetical protein [Anaerocolumna aminovalerica]SFO43884.1 hypothetical protein SAMN04489757_12630 [Anaerocolumna aminovalerica]
MKIKNIKRKCIILSLILILTGVLISIAGFGVAGFDYNRLKKEATHDPWYQTIHINSDTPWYGVKFGNNIHLMNIGNAD